jgi:hypothetical protein
VNKETVRLILTKDENMKKVYAKMVMKNLSCKQNMRRKEFCPDLSVGYWINLSFWKNTHQR